MANERVENSLRDEYFGQLAFSQKNRTNFSPGKASARALDENWPKDFPVAVGNPALENTITKRTRVALIGRNSVCDQTLTAVPTDPANTTQDNNGKNERNSGYENQMFNNQYALQFDGVMSYAAGPIGFLPLVGLTQGAVSFWIKRTTDFLPPVSNNNYRFIGGNENLGLGSRLISSGKLTISTYYYDPSTGTDNQNAKSSDNVLNVDQWYHCLVSLDTSLSTDGLRFRAWIDGVEFGINALMPINAIISATPTTTTLYFGRISSFYFNCAVDEVSYWNIHQTDPSKMRTDDGKPKDLYGEAGLLYWYRMGDFYQSGSSTIVNRVDGTNNLTLFNISESTDFIEGVS